MSIITALFSPTTIVEKKNFWIGGAILIVLGAMVAVLPLLFMTKDAGFSGMMIGSMFSMLLYALIYPWFCLIGGRLRDTGNSPLIYIAALVGYGMLSMIISMILIMPDMIANVEGMLENMPDDSDNPEDAFEDMMIVQQDLMRKMIPKQMIGSAIASFLTMLPFGLMKQKLENNRYRDDPTVFD